MRIPVPQYQRSVEPSVPGGQALAREQPTGIDDLARGFQQVANVREREAAQAQDNYLRIEHEQKKARVSERSSNDRLKWTELQLERQTAAAPGAEGFTPGLLKEFDTYSKQALDGVKDEAERDMYKGMLQRLRENVGENAFVFEAGSRRSYRKQVLTDGVNVDARVLAMDPMQFSDVLGNRLASINGSTDLPQADRAALAQRSRDLLSFTAAQTMVERDPANWLDMTSSPEKAKRHPIFGHIPPERLASLNSHARSLVEHGKQQDKYRLQSQVRDVQTMVLSGVAPPAGSIPTEEHFVSAFGADGSLRYREEVGSYLELGGVLGQLQAASYAERRQMIEGAQPAPGQGFAVGMRNAETVTKANALLEKRIVSDPAFYAMQTSPRVQKAAAIMERVLNDPKMPAEDRVAAMNFYAETQMAWQQHVGVQQINDHARGDEKRAAPLRLLTNQQANAIANRFYDQTQGGAKAADLVAGLEQQWGQHWPSVYAQLASDNKLPPAALVIPNMPNDASRARMAAASAMKPDDLKALVAGTDPGEVRDALLSQFEPAQRTFTAQGADGSRTLALVMGEAEKLALVYRSEGKSVSQAAKQAYTETMGHRYEFGDTYRIPRDQQAPEVKAGASFAHRKLSEAADLQVFSADTPQILTSDAVRARGFWVTAGDESGLRFVVQGADGGVYAVRDKAGQPINYGWESLRKMAAEAKTPQAQDDEHREEMKRRQRELNPNYLLRKTR
jgi:hypothetical protein